MANTTDVFNVRKSLDKLIELTGKMRLPAFLSDPYGDAIAANRIILAFFDIPPVVLETAPQVPGGFNTVRINFGKESVARSRIEDKWDNYALNSMRSFREHSLRYRAQPYFKYLMETFRNPAEFPLFDRYWKMVSSIEQDKEINTDYFDYQHDQYGLVRYTASATITITSFGELFLIQYLPLDQSTARTFEQIAQKVGQAVVPLAPWPVKNFGK